MDTKAANRIKILSAIAKAKQLGRVYSRAKREYIDRTSKHLPTKADFQAYFTTYIKTQK